MTCSQKLIKISLLLFAFLHINNTCFTQIVENDSLDEYSLDEFIFYSERSIDSKKMDIRKGDFKRMAASFDDPTRLLMHYPGFSADNDQANEVIYHGLSSSLMTWQLNGIDIVNPNHLSNAGNGSDLSSLGAGGVNMMSGNIINGYQFQSPTSANFLTTGLGGGINIDIDSLQKNYVQLSVLGLESGWKLKKNNWQAFANYRYSFTGLLSDFGVKFGNEDIRFNDLVVGLGRFTKKSKFTLNYLTGQSSNEHNANTSNPLVQKDFLDIDYNSKINIVVANYELKWKENLKFNIKTAYSNKDDSRLLKGPIKLQSIALEANDAFQWQNEKISMDANLENKYLTAGIRGVMNNINTENKSLINYNAVNKYNEITPYLASKIKKGQFAIQTYVGLLINEAIPLFNLKADYKIGIVNLGYSFSRRAQTIETVENVNRKYTMSFNNQLDASIDFNQVKINFILFHHQLNNAPIKGLDGLHAIDYYRGTSNSLDIFGNGKIYGSTFNMDYQKNNFWCNANATLMGSDYQSEAFAKYIVNFNAGKNIKLKNNILMIASSINMKSPKNVFPILLNSHIPIKKYNDNLIILNNYSRWDLRINYTTKKAMWSLDIQNLMSRVNESFIYNDIDGVKVGGGLGLLPVLSYRREI